jgi:choline-sulfatase
MPAPVGVEDPQAIAYWKEMRAAYADLTHLVDHEMGLVFAALEQLGWLDDTLIIHCTDHGDLIGDIGTWHKGKPEDASLRTPWFVRLPGVVPAAVQSDAPVAAVDVAATCLGAAGISEPLDCLLPQSPSTDWWPHLTAQAESPRSFAYAECGGWRQVSDAEWKYIYYPADGRERLHHRPTDPWDLTDLSDHPSHAAVLERCRMELLWRMARECIAPDTRAFHQQRAVNDEGRKAWRSQWQHLPQVPKHLKPE